MTKDRQVYGDALYDLAKESQLTEDILLQLRQVLEIFAQNPQYERFLTLPSIPKAERCRALDEAFGGKIHPYLLNFMKILCENDAMDRLKDCGVQYQNRYYEEKGIVQVCAVTAVPMSRQQRQQLLEKLQKTLGKTVELQERVEPACMGGVRLEWPGQQLDGTVKGRLDAMNSLLKI